MPIQSCCCRPNQSSLELQGPLLEDPDSREGKTEKRARYFALVTGAVALAGLFLTAVWTQKLDVESADEPVKWITRIVIGASGVSGIGFSIKAIMACRRVP